MLAPKKQVNKKGKQVKKYMDKESNKDVITIYEYWPHEHMEVKLRPENFEKYINKIGEARRRFIDLRRKEAKERKEREEKDRDET